jgi:hypothetical protein
MEAQEVANRSGAVHESRTAFFLVKPEDAGHPDRERSGGFVFDTWLGDDLVSAQPDLLVTTPLKKDLESLDEATGFGLSPARTSCSTFFRRHKPQLTLPPFWAINVDGEPGNDDIGLTRDGSLVVSQRVMDVLVRHRVVRAAFWLFSPARRGCEADDQHELRGL